MTASYLAGVARRTAPGRTPLLPPVTAWGIETWPDAPQAVPPASASATEVPERHVPPPPQAERPVAARGESLQLSVGRAGAPNDSTPAATEPESAEPSVGPEPPRRPDAEATSEVEGVPLKRTDPEIGDIGRFYQMAEPLEQPWRRLPSRERREDAASDELVSVAEPTYHAAASPSPRPVGSPDPVQPVRIESIEVVVERPLASPAPAGPPVERRQAPAGVTVPPSTLARGFSSLIGLRQG